MDGGRQKWEAEGREYTREKPARPATEYPVVSRDDEQIRAFLPEVRDAIGSIPLIDVRSAEEYSGERTHMPAYPEEGALRGGHIPTAKSVPWAKAANEDGTFKSADQLKSLYLDDLGLEAGSDIIAYCRIGERSSHTWFVLSHLLGFDSVKNYDGSWTEWGNVVRVPIVTGDQPGEAPGA
jgi:thiosulfate/3-mercaptopyruvate sulfurtransferase